MHGEFGRRVERAKSPILFWMAFVGNAVILLIIGALLLTIIVTKPG